MVELVSMSCCCCCCGGVGIDVPLIVVAGDVMWLYDANMLLLLLVT